MLPQWPSESFGGGPLCDGVPLSADVSEEVSNLEEVRFDAGPPQRRAKASSRVLAIDFALPIESDAHLAVLLTFYDQTLNGGRGYFEWALPSNDASLVRMQFREYPRHRLVELPEFWSAEIRLRAFE